MDQIATQRNEGRNHRTSDTYCDNTSVVNISKNLVMHIKTKHIAVKYHYLRELVQDKEVKKEYVNTKEKKFDIFTKALPKDAHEYLRIN